MADTRIRELLRSGAPEGPGEVPSEAIRQRGSRRRARRRAGFAMLGLVGVGLVATVALGQLGFQRVTFPPADEGPSGEPEPAPPAAADVAESLRGFAWEVVAVGVTPVGFFAGGGGHVATDQGKVDRLWQTFEMQGDAPLLQPGQAALILPVSGSCDRAAQVHAIEPIVSSGASEVFAAVQLDGSCAFFSGDGMAPPTSTRTLYVIAVPHDIARHLSGALALTAAVGDFDWQVLTVRVTQRWYYPGSFSEQTDVDQMWRMYEMPPPAPALPAGHGALFVPVAGSCTNAAQVLTVDAVAYDPRGREPVAAVYFDPSCAEPQPDSGNLGQSTLYTIAVPVDVAASLGGAVAYIACGNAPPADTGTDAPHNVCADPTDNAVSANSVAFAADFAAAMGDLDFEVLAVGVTPDPSMAGYIAGGQETVDDLWEMLGMDGAAPTLTADRGALFVPVAGTCDHASHIGRVDVRTGADLTALVAVAHVDAGCAQPPEEAIGNPAPRMLYVIAIPRETAGRLDAVTSAAGA